MKYLFLLSALLGVGYGFAMEENEDAERKKCEARLVFAFRHWGVPHGTICQDYIVSSCSAARRIVENHRNKNYLVYSLEIEQKGILYNSQKTFHAIPISQALYELDKVCAYKNK